MASRWSRRWLRPASPRASRERSSIPTTRPTSPRKSSRWRQARCCSISRSRASGSSPWASAATCCSPTTRAPPGARRRACPRASCSRRSSSSMRIRLGRRPRRNHPQYRRWRRNLDALALRARSAAAAAGPVVREPRQRHCRWRLRRLLHHQRRRPPLVQRQVLAPPPAPPQTPANEDEPPPDYHLNRIVGVGNRLYVAAEGGKLYRSDDRGASWRDAALAVRRQLLRAGADPRRRPARVRPARPPVPLGRCRARPGTSSSPTPPPC